MSESPLTVRTRIEEINVDEETSSDKEHKGYVDVRYWLDRGDELLGFATVRIFFKRTDIPLDALTSAALAQGHHVLSQIAKEYKPASADAERLW
jgi:hypothetical protein